MSVWLWFFFAALLVLPVLLRMAGDEPRNDEPPDTDGGVEASLAL